MQHNATRIITPSYSPLPVIASADKGIESGLFLRSFVSPAMGEGGRKEGQRRRRTEENVNTIREKEEGGIGFDK